MDSPSFSRIVTIIVVYFYDIVTIGVIRYTRIETLVVVYFRGIVTIGVKLFIGQIGGTVYRLTTTRSRRSGHSASTPWIYTLHTDTVFIRTTFGL